MLAMAGAAAVDPGARAWAAAAERIDQQAAQTLPLAALAQAAQQQQPSAEQVQLANIIARVCPTLDACQQGLAGLLVRLNTVQQQLLLSQEQVRQLNALVAEKDAEAQGQGATEDQAAAMAQVRDDALARLAEAARIAQEQAKEVQRLNGQVTSLEAQIRQLRFKNDGDSEGEQGQQSLIRPLTLDALNSGAGDLERLRQEREALRTEVRKLNEKLAGSAEGLRLGQGNGSVAQAAALELERLRTEVGRLTADNRRQQQEGMNNSARIDRLQESLNEAQIDLATLRLERDKLRTALTAAQGGQSAASDASQTSEQDQRSRQAMIDRMGKLEAELEQARQQIARLRQDKQNLEAALEDGAAEQGDSGSSAQELAELNQALQAARADKAALERQLIKLEQDRRSNRDEVALLTQAVQQRDQTIAQLSDELQRLQSQSQGSEGPQALAALQAEQAARANERAEYERLLAELGGQNRQLEQTLDALRAASDEERRGLVAEITRLSDELLQLREFVDLQKAQSGDQQDAVARLTQALEDAEQKHSAQLDLLGRAEIEIKALLADLNTARSAVSDSQAQRQQAINDALELRRLLDDLIQERDQLALQVTALRQNGDRQAEQQAQLAASQIAFREVEADRDRLRGLLAEKQREALDLDRQLQRRQALIDAQTAVGRNYDLLVTQLNDAEAELVLARMQISALQQRLQGLDQQSRDLAPPAARSAVPSLVEPALLARPQAADAQGDRDGSSAVPGLTLQGDPDLDARTLRLLDELRRIGR